MRQMIKIALLAGTALAAAGCNRQAAVNNSVVNEVGQTENMMAPGPDASAVETVNTAPMPAPLPPPAAGNGSDDATSSDAPGGDLGGNNVETNTPGM